MLGPIYVFHTVERERTALERDLARVALPVKTFASAGALALASVEEAPSLVIWDLDAGKVRGGPDRVATRFRCPVVGLTTDRERVSEADRMPSLVLPAERWRVAPIVLRLLGQAQREEPPAREASPLPPPVSNIFTRPRVLSDTEVDAKRGPKDREEAAPGAHALPVSRTAATVKKPMTVRAPRAGRAPGVGSAAAASAAAAATAAAVAPARRPRATTRARIPAVAAIVTPAPEVVEPVNEARRVEPPPSPEPPPLPPPKPRPSEARAASAPTVPVAKAPAPAPASAPAAPAAPAPEPAAAAPVAKAPAGPPRILIADDDEVLQHILAYQLAEHRWQVQTTRDGVEALGLLRRDGADVLLLDLNLPHKNGFEILEELGPAGTASLRVIVMSEQVQDDKIIRAFSLGAHDFVQKPLNPRVVVSRIQRLLRSE